MSIYNIDLDKNAANYQPLTPLSFLARSALVYPDHPAIVHGKQRTTYAAFYGRARQLASALVKAGIKKGETVSAILANTPAMLECHYGVPMMGAVLNTLNTRLDAATIGFSLDHAETKLLFVDKEFSALAKNAIQLIKGPKPIIVDYVDPEFPVDGERLSSVEYEQFLAGGDAGFKWLTPIDEWDAISLNYTSGTTGNPKGWSIIIAALTCWRKAMWWLRPCRSIRCIFGRCPCFTAMAGASRGRSRWLAAPT
jgi:fatty-acyl-CoA synthase